ncbi:MAG: hypothetical protein D3903_14670 [Candidatus Electrothrix sp. GM3_4]|nr:hypothetical protein [Candidatus Electrothrix sp. GM3_4]
MEIKEILLATKMFLAFGLVLAGAVSGAEPESRGIVNIVSGTGSSTAVAVGPGSHAVAGEISVDGQTVITGTTIQEVGVKKTELRSLPSYRSIEIGNFPGKVVLRFNKKNNAVVTADQAVVPAIKTTVKNGALFIGLQESVSTRTPLQLQLNAEGISSLYINGIADVVIEDVAADHLRLEINGSGTVVASGKVRELEEILAGSGHFKTGDLVAEQCTVRIDGAGDAIVHVTGMLHAEINGAGNIVYFGAPSEVIRNINGAGGIEPADN